MGTQLTIDELHHEQLELLKGFDSFCHRHGLSYSLAGGTLLGAIRHKGFIPWDDDIDVALSRPEYEKLIELVSELQAPYRLTGFQDLALDVSPYAKFTNANVFVRESSFSTDGNLWLDVFPIDGFSESINTVGKMMSKATLRRRLLVALYAKPESGLSALRRFAKFLLLPFRNTFCRRLLAKSLSRVATSIPYGSTSYVGGIVWGQYGIGERISLDGFEKKVHLEFEGARFEAMSNWDEYLSGCYGDYMRLPPEDKRRTHGVEAWKVE